MDIDVQVDNLNNDSDSGLYRKESVIISGKKEFVSSLKEKGNKVVGFDIPLSIFNYRDYSSDFFTSWYNVSSKIFKEINRACPEKRVLNLSLSVLIFPYITFVVLGLVVFNSFKADSKIQTSFWVDKIREGKASKSIIKRLAYGVLTMIVILIDVAVLMVLIIPATLALTTFYLLNRELSCSLIAALRVNMGMCYNKHQNISVSFYEISHGTEVLRPNVVCDMEIKFPPQFERLLSDLCESSKLSITQDAEHNTVLKMSANFCLKNGLVHLHSEIKNVISKSIQEFAKTIEKLVKLKKKDITYDKLKKLLNEFRLEVMDSVDFKLTSHLIQDAYRVAFIQAVKIAQKEREKGGGLDIEERLKEVLVEQKLKSQGKELPTEKEIIIKDLKISNNLRSGVLPLFRAKWKQRMAGGIIGVYSEIYPHETEKATSEARNLIEELKEKGERKYQDIKEKLKMIYPKIHEALRRDSNSVSNNLRRSLEDIFKFEPANQKVYRELIKSKIRKAEILLNQSGLAIDIKDGLLNEFYNLDANVCSYQEVNLLLEKMYLEIIKCKTQSLFQEQGKSIRDIEDNTGVFMLFDRKVEEQLVNRIVSYREEIGKYLMQPVELKEIVRKQNRVLSNENEESSKEDESLSVELIELCLKNNQEILETLERLELEKERFLINEKTENNYKEELASREKIRFAVIEDDLLMICKQKTFNEEEVKKLLERAELECCLAEKCIKYPVIKTKDNIKHFCQALLSPLIGILMENIINNVPKNISKDNENNLLDQSWGWIYRRVIKPAQIALNYNKLGLLAIGDKNSIEGKALDSAHDIYKQVETLLQYFELSYEEVGALVGNVFSDGGETFKKDIWPQVKEHLCGMWNRFFKDIEFTLVSGSKNICQEPEKAVKTELSNLITQRYDSNLCMIA
ncbi:hypothetical protein GOY13_00295 [Wolbachia endosymbiont of Cruorifilaria tuberocauda]|uniref:hypothetical protein n=1 Tax=Wolbachia endosymbiont of Cruorifilaria tuberocauda TaxID=1812111 RepID=UPI00158D9016|nr:hypothetical protein [Wolbachia endosymbiont of Cruorifilaria tuberocauda]QKX01421.1 hypothetical protein GOY13_00295 [Wolbachia endosymbiont of Cruorifilaria tuberocauda]